MPPAGPPRPDASGGRLTGRRHVLDCGCVRPPSLPEPAARALFVAAGLVVALATVEAAARLTWTAPWYQRLEAEQQRNEHLPYRLNSLGLRDREVRFEKAPGTLRLLVLGDSFTFGQGVRNAATFARRLERGLNGAPGLSAPVEVLNAGLRGSLTRDWLDVWRRVGVPWQPNAVLVVFFLRDGTRIASIPEFFGPIRDEIAARNRTSWLYHHLYAYRVLCDRLDRRAITSAYLERFRASYFGSAEETAEWSAARRHLHTLFFECHERSIPLGLAVFPVLAQLDESYPFRPISDLVLEWARVEGMPTHDLLPAFLGRDASRLWVSAWDQHPNAEAHAVAAQSLLPVARALLTADR
jgi:lysophospholipase L1-like esterase